MAFFLSPLPHLQAFISACRFHLNSQLQRISRKPLRSPNPTKTHSFKTMTTYSFESMKMEKIRAPYGSWKPPITAELSPAPPSYSVALLLILSATSSGSSHAPMLSQARNIYHALLLWSMKENNTVSAEAESTKFTLEQQMIVFSRLVGRFKVAEEITPTRIDNLD
ncbi:hypothetical protein ACFX2I_016752 [Malus domestica]